jgi:peptidyl-dipeptidase Dcp
MVLSLKPKLYYMKSTNPLYDSWETPFNSPPFGKILSQHFVPAIKMAIDDANAEIEKITLNKEPADFSNTIEALEMCGKRVGEIAAVLFNLNIAETTSELQKVAQEVSPLLTRFANSITLNSELYNRITTASSVLGTNQLSNEQRLLTEKKLRSFILGGAGLSEDKKPIFRKITEELSMLTLQFEENLLAETNAFELHLTTVDSLAGLPETVISAASEEAAKRDKVGWVFTLHHPSFIPFMQYSEKRELRKNMFLGFSSRCFKGGKNDNRELVKRIVNLRLELANLLGYKSFADMILEDRMVGSATAVLEFLDNLNKESAKAAKRDIDEVIEYAGTNGMDKDFERWDWAFWSEKLKMERFSIDDETLKPYFNLNLAEKAIFELVNKLYNITFTPLSDIQLYHNDVRVFEVNEDNGSHLALLMIDYHPREGKSGGAWMTSFREQYIKDDVDVRPIISIVTNFSRASGSTPALLTHGELTTFLHEFGHALHGIFSKCRYETLSGTNVARDFVELPSQIMENWAYEKSWLDTWAVHYTTGEKIPDRVMEMICELLTYNEGYASNRQLGFGYLDMAWHMLPKKFSGDITRFEENSTKKTKLFKYIEGTNQSCAFGHLFSGGYGAGYYGYKWAEVLDADAFSLFKERGITDTATALSFRRNILERGASDDPKILYRNFRGAEPSIDPLLRRCGFKKE